MIRMIGDPVIAVTRFNDSGSFSPVRLRWRNHDIKVTEITGRWSCHDGQYKIYNFALVGEGDAYYEVSFHTRDMTWYIDKMAVED